MLHVYGKVGCSRCDVAKQQLNQKGIGYHYYTMDQDYNADWLKTQIPTSAKKLPVIFSENADGSRTFMKESDYNKLIYNT